MPDAEAEAQLGRAIGTEVKLVRYPSYGQLMAAMLHAQVEIAWLPPVLCVTAVDSGMTLILACVRRARKLYHGAIFVPDASPIRTASELRGTRIAWVDTESASGYLFPLAALEAKGMKLDGFFREEIFAGSHPAVVQAVADGSADCGATHYDVVPDQPVSTGWGDRPMRAIVVSEPIPSDAICAGIHVRCETRARIVDALSQLHRDEEGARLLQDLLDVTRLDPAQPPHYERVRNAIGLAPLSRR